MGLTQAQTTQQQKVQRLEQERKVLLDQIASDKDNSKLIQQFREKEIELKRAKGTFKDMKGSRTSADYKRAGTTEKEFNKSKQKRYVQDTKKVAGKVYTGITDKQTGEFIPDGTDLEEAKQYQRDKKVLDKASEGSLVIRNEKGNLVASKNAEWLQRKIDKQQRTLDKQSQTTVEQSSNTISTSQPKPSPLGNINNLSSPIEQQLIYTQTSTPAQIQAMQNVNSTFVNGKTATFSFNSPKDGEVNLNPARIFIAPYQLGAKAGDYLAENVRGRKSIVTDVKSGIDNVKEQGVAQTAKNIAKGVIYSVGSDPFGFTGESLALGGGGKIAKQSIRNYRTNVEIKNVETKSVTIDSNSKGTGVGIEAVDVKATVEVSRPRTLGESVKEFVVSDSTSPTSRKKTEIFEIEGKGVLDKQQRALGQSEPDFFISKPNSLSREISPADISEGKVTFNVQGRSSTVKVDNLRQGNKQITNVGKDTFVSETQVIGQLNNENILRTTTQNIKSNDVAVTLSKPSIASSSSPTKEAFISGFESQTESVIKQSSKGLGIDERIIEVELSSSKLSKSNLAIEYKNKVSNIEISFPEPKISVNNPSKPSNQRDFSFEKQGQVFEERTVNEAVSTGLSKLEQNTLKNSKASSSYQKNSPTNIPISEKLAKDLVLDKKISSVKPVSTSFGSIDTTSFNFESSVDQIGSQSKIPAQSSFIDNASSTDSSSVFDSSFSFSSASATDSKSLPKNLFDDGGASQRSPPPIVPKIPANGIKLDLDFDPKSKKKKKNQSSSQSNLDGGRYVSSLGAALTDQFSKNPTQDSSGLRVRAIQIKK